MRSPASVRLPGGSTQLGGSPVRFGPIDEWHVDPEKIVTVEKLGGYPTCPASRKKRYLRAIRPIDRRIEPPENTPECRGQSKHFSIQETAGSFLESNIASALQEQGGWARAKGRMGS
jgi:hypothetical protein